METPATTPDTLDLTQRARLALRHLAANRDSRTGYPYFYLHVASDRPSATHDGWDYVDQLSRYIDAMMLAREMTGDDHGRDSEAIYRRLLLERLDPEDGLAYRPESAWSLPEAGMFDQSRALNALVTWHLKEGDPEIRRRIVALVEGLWAIAIRVVQRRTGRDYCYHPFAGRFKDGWNPALPGETCCYSGGSLILPLVKCHEAIGDERSLEMARRLTNYVVHESGVFRPDGSFWPRQMLPEHAHFHSKTLTLAGILRFALFVGDADLVSFCKRAFDWAMTQSGSFGFFPEGVGTEDFYSTKHSETCDITDMIHLAMKLGEAGHPEYWGHAERFIRNHLVESQWTSESWLPEPSPDLPEDTESQTYRDMPERIMGGFAGRTRPNEFSADGMMMGCCCGAGPRALFLAWDHILTRSAEGLFLNLHLNRFSAQADIFSSLPYAGRVEAHLHSEGPLHLRLPEGVASSSVVFERNGKPVSPTIRDGYARIEDAESGDRIVMTFPTRTEERTERRHFGEYRMKWRGETVVSMEPRGVRFPLYQRSDPDGANPLSRAWSPSERRDSSFHW